MSLGRDTIISLGSKLPPALGIFGRLRALLDDADTDLDAIVELVRVDPALTFQVIRLSNSALYGMRSRCLALEDAVARIGFGEIHQLVGLVVSRQTFQGDLRLYDIQASRLWENAVALGTLASSFAKRASSDPGSAYSTGLLRNLGKIILNNFPGAVHYPGPALQPDVFAWELATHGMAAPEATAILLDHWSFAPGVAGAVCLHREAERGSEFALCAAQLHLACGVAVDWGCALPGESTGWRRDLQICAQAGLTEEDFTGAIEEARQLFDRFAKVEWGQTA